MKLLLDTHALLWFVWNHANLSDREFWRRVDRLTNDCKGSF